MQFGPSQKKRFSCTDGAYSIVTDREYKDSQVTLTDHEARIVLTHFGEEFILQGPVKSDPALAGKEFAEYKTGEPITINVNFPKSQGKELRLYLNKRFKPEGGQVMYLFPQGDRLYIGAMTESEWRAGSADLVRDESDGIYQEGLVESSDIRVASLKERDAYVRDRSVALASLENSGYVCEFDNTHELFVARRSRKNYLEAHHLIPMEFQAEFKVSLDTVQNVYSLCPHCHRAVHYAEKETTKCILSDLIEKRNVLSDFNLEKNDLYALYGVEDIL